MAETANLKRGWLKPPDLIGLPSRPVMIHFYRPWREPLRGWLTTTRLETNAWTRHGTNNFLGPQLWVGGPHETNGCSTTSFLRTLRYTAIRFVLVPRSWWVTGAVILPTRQFWNNGSGKEESLQKTEEGAGIWLYPRKENDHLFLNGEIYALTRGLLMGNLSLPKVQRNPNRFDIAGGCVATSPRPQRKIHK